MNGSGWVRVSGHGKVVWGFEMAVCRVDMAESPLAGAMEFSCRLDQRCPKPSTVGVVETQRVG
jgi:hypothetical protein